MITFDGNGKLFVYRGDLVRRLIITFKFLTILVYNVTLSLST